MIRATIIASAVAIALATAIWITAPQPYVRPYISPWQGGGGTIP